MKCDLRSECHIVSELASIEQNPSTFYRWWGWQMIACNRNKNCTYLGIVLIQIVICWCDYRAKNIHLSIIPCGWNPFSSADKENIKITQIRSNKQMRENNELTFVSKDFMGQFTYIINCIQYPIRSGVTVSNNTQKNEEENVKINRLIN